MSRDSPTLSAQGFWNGSARDSTRNSRNNGGHDPPRPAREGFEWVWFPDGYWAERPAPRRTSSKNPGTISAGSAGKIFKWTSRANGGPAPSQDQELRDLSPKTVQSTPPLSLPQLHLPNNNSGSFSPPRTFPHSPWLSEAAQVQALQRPADQQMSFVSTNKTDEQSLYSRRRSSGKHSATLATQEKSKAPRSKSSWNLFQRSKVSESLSRYVFCEWFRKAESNRSRTL